MWLMHLCWMKGQLLQRPCSYVTGTVFKCVVKSQLEVVLELEGIYPCVGNGLKLSVAFSL